MRNGTSTRRLVENEANFRQINERTHEGFMLVNQYASEDRQPEFTVSKDKLFNFFCECSNAECKDTIRIAIGKYGVIHKDRKTFVVKPGHVNDKIEHIIDTKPEYVIVRKNI